MTSYGFHSEAADEYVATTQYYLEHASPLVAAAFVAEVEEAIQRLLSTPKIGAVVENNIHRPSLRGFPVQFTIVGNQSKIAFRSMR